MALRGIPPGVWLAVVAAVALVAVACSSTAAFGAWRTRRRLARSRERGARGEQLAEGLLERLGFRVLARQVAVTYELLVDGSAVTVDLRADLVVADARGRYVAEVKTGELAPAIETAATRRQLLEYRVAFERYGVRGVLLVDADARRVRVVEFPFPGPRARHEPALAWLLAGIVAGTLAVAASRFL